MPCMPWGPYDEEKPPAKKRTLMAVKDSLQAVKIREAIGSIDEIYVTSPDIGIYASDFDTLVMCFDPQTTKEQQWYHLVLVPRLKTGGTVLWSC